MLYVHIGRTITFTHSTTSGGGAFVIDCPHLSGWGGAIVPSAPIPQPMGKLHAESVTNM